MIKTINPNLNCQTWTDITSTEGLASGLNYCLDADHLIIHNCKELAFRLTVFPSNNL